MRLLFRTVLLASIALPGALAIPHPAAAQNQVDSREGIALQNQIYQLRQELKQLQDQRNYGGQTYGSQPRMNSNTSDLLTQLLSRVDSLEDQVRQMRGRIDEMQNQAQRDNQALNKKIDDLKFQVDSGAGAGSTAAVQRPPAPLPTGQLTPPSSYTATGGPAPSYGAGAGYGSAPSYNSQPAPYSGAPAAPSGGPINLLAPQPPQPPQAPPLALQPRSGGPRTPEMAIQDGNNALGRRDYAMAESAAREVLANRTSPRAYDAKLLLAQSLEGQKQYPQAAIAYDDAYNMSRKGSHAEDALVGLASSLAAIKENKAACDTLSRLRADFPAVRADLKPNIAAIQQKASCR